MVVEHIWDETNKADPLPPLLIQLFVVFDVEYGDGDELVTVDAAVADVALTTRIFVTIMLALPFTAWPFTTIPFDMSSTIVLPPISRVRFGTRPYRTALIRKVKE